MQKIVITGGTGFVGRSICEHLAAQDAACRLVVPTRRPAPASSSTARAWPPRWAWAPRC